MGAEEDALEQAAFEITRTHQTLVQARHLVDELHHNVRSATSYLDDAELDAAKAQLAEADPGERSERFYEAARDDLQHVSARCRSGREVSSDLVEVVAEAGRHLEMAAQYTHVHPQSAAHLAPQVDALRDLLAVTEPIATAAHRHLSTASDLAERAAETLEENGTFTQRLTQQVTTVGHEVSRADEDVRLADVAVDRVHGAASRAANLAASISDTARARMAIEQQQALRAGPAAGGGAPPR